MSTSQLWPISVPASADFSASTYAYCGFTYDTNGRLILPTAGGTIIGVLENKPNAIDQPGLIFGCGSGKRKLQYGGTVTAADPLKVNASGQFVTASGSDVAAGSAVALASVSGVTGQIGEGIIIGNAGAFSTVAGDEVVTSGALSLQTDISYLSITGTKAYSLGTPKFAGQKKRIEVNVAATSPVGTLTISAPFTGDQATYTFDTVNQSISLVAETISAGVFGWHITDKKRAGAPAAQVVMGTTNLGADDMHEYIDLSITGSVTSSLANGNVPGERIYFDVKTASTTPKGILTGSFQTKLGVASASWGVTSTEITSTSALVGVEWNGAKWREILATAVAAFA